MKYVFIDSNIWLSLYHFSSDDLEQFSKLQKLLGKNIHLIIPSQIIDEVYRNRDNKIKDALSRFENFNFIFPAFCKNYDAYPPFRKEYELLKEKHKEWLKTINKDIREKTLPADLVINEFFQSSSITERTDEMVRAAELRYKIGNPPGKDNKYGDAINWECLLQSVPDGTDLYFISSDKDYASVINDKQFNLFLDREWQAKKGSSIFFYKSLVSFLNEHFSEIKLQTEQAKDDLISALSTSGNFANTHLLIKQLNAYTDWSPEQKENLICAALDNSQVSWILDDEDVARFYQGLLKNLEKPSDNAIKLLDYYRKNVSQDPFQDVFDIDELPF